MTQAVRSSDGFPGLIDAERGQPAPTLCAQRWEGAERAERSQEGSCKRKQAHSRRQGWQENEHRCNEADQAKYATPSSPALFIVPKFASGPSQ
jgi:hypothetical protein